MNIQGNKRAALASTSLLAAIALATPVHAQDDANDAATSGTDDVIIVTANRRDQSLQDVPLSITAFGGDELENRSISSIEQVGAIAPGVQISTYQGDTSIFIRGIGTPSIIAGTDSSTATYVDGVYISRPAAIGPQFFDIDRVEVLRGPQGTLYGRNATGGAVNIVTNRPTDALEGNLQLTAGNYDRFRLAGALSGPLTDGIRARLAFQWEDRGGYATVTRPDNSTERVEDKEDYAIRLTVEADISPDATLILNGDYYRANDKANAYFYASAGYGDEIPDWYSSREGAQTLAYFAMKNAGRVSEAGSRDIFADADYFNKVENWGLGATLDWDIADYNLKVIGSYRDTNPISQNEFDLSDAYVNYVGREEDHWQWSGEVQLSSPVDKPFSWIAGAYYFEESNVIDNDIFGNFWEPVLIQGLTDLQNAGVIPTFPIIFPDSDLCCELHLSGAQETKAWAAYLDTQWNVSDQLTIRLGGRYSEERRNGRQNFDLVILPDMRVGPNVALFPNAVSEDPDVLQPDPFGFNVGPVNGPSTFRAFTPKLGIDFKPNDDVLLYASIQRGFKSGGYNIGSSQRDPFEPEKIWSYEIGARTELLDRALLLNASAFWYDYTNLQAQDSVGNQPLIRNVGKARVRGFEVESVARPTDFLRLEGALTYVDAQFTEGTLTESLRPAPLAQPAGSLQRDLDGLRLPRAPRWKLSIAGQVEQPVGDSGTVTVRAEYHWQSKIYFTVFNIDAASQDSYGLLRASLGFTSADDKWGIRLFGDNLTGKTYFTNQILTGGFYGAEFVGPLGAPRTYGVDLRFNF
ncbi:TonB-dependent receptor [Sphingorhabdus sp. SMR4y]|uniref:TonB-dependent receptor n=1 Tax=Sphingorhabdus sp. SMR4y TaxID=2584094 RepID=UPI000B5FFCC2|nr:TonB-dependent receptor [Sphingorhabdus sp. SMR4y]ASK86973.1 ferripyoverdine receptor [Sphingorhabdus sp. SMR4y]